VVWQSLNKRDGEPEVVAVGGIAIEGDVMLCGLLFVRAKTTAARQTLKALDGRHARVLLPPTALGLLTDAWALEETLELQDKQEAVGG
jgi:hypothetical protein